MKGLIFAVCSTIALVVFASSPAASADDALPENIRHRLASYRLQIRNQNEIIAELRAQIEELRAENERLRARIQDGEPDGEPARGTGHDPGEERGEPGVEPIEAQEADGEDAESFTNEDVHQLGMAWREMLRSEIMMTREQLHQTREEIRTRLIGETLTFEGQVNRVRRVTGGGFQVELGTQTDARAATGQPQGEVTLRYRTNDPDVMELREGQEHSARLNVTEFEIVGSMARYVIRIVGVDAEQGAESREP